MGDLEVAYSVVAITCSRRCVRMRCARASSPPSSASSWTSSASGPGPRPGWPCSISSRASTIRVEGTRASVTSRRSTSSARMASRTSPLELGEWVRPREAGDALRSTGRGRKQHVQTPAFTCPRKRDSFTPRSARPASWSARCVRSTDEPTWGLAGASRGSPASSSPAGETTQS